MHLRRTLALAASALLLSALSACSEDSGTMEPYTPAAGTNNQDTEVDVLNAVIVSAEDGSGTLVAGLANGDNEEAATLSGIEGESVSADSFSPVEIPANGFVNLADEGGIEVSGEFELGDFVPLTLQFDGQDPVDMDVPVVANCDDFAGIDGPEDEEACAYAEHESGH